MITVLIKEIPKEWNNDCTKEEILENESLVGTISKGQHKGNYIRLLPSYNNIPIEMINIIEEVY